MTRPLTGPALTLMRNTYANHEALVARYQSGMTPTSRELAAAYVGAVADLGMLLAHVAEHTDDDASEVCYTALNFVHKWELWHETPHDQTAFAELHDAQNALREAVGEYNIGAFRGEG